MAIRNGLIRKIATRLWTAAGKPSDETMDAKLISGMRDILYLARDTAADSELRRTRLGGPKTDPAAPFPRADWELVDRLKRMIRSLRRANTDRRIAYHQLEREFLKNHPLLLILRIDPQQTAVRRMYRWIPKNLAEAKSELPVLEEIYRQKSDKGGRSPDRYLARTVRQFADVYIEATGRQPTQGRTEAPSVFERYLADALALSGIHLGDRAINARTRGLVAYLKRQDRAATETGGG